MVFQGMEGFELKTARCHPEASDIDMALLSQAQSVEVADNEGRTLLHLAAMQGDSHACRSLLSAGADPVRPDLSGRVASALARSAGHFELAAALEGRIEAPAEIAARSPLELRELMGLIGDNQRIVEGLIDSKRLNARDAKGDTPLHIVAMRGKMKASDLLVRSGADLYAMNLQGLTPAEAAASNGHAMLAALLAAASGIALAKDATWLEPLVNVPLPDVVPTQAAADASFELPDTFEIEALHDPSDFHAEHGSPETRGEFERQHRDIQVRSGGEEAKLDIDLGRSGGEVEGEGIDGSNPREFSDEEPKQPDGRVGLRRAAQPSAWAHFQIDRVACATIIARIIDVGYMVEDDLEYLIGLCQGRFDATDLRVNILREIEAAGFALLENAEEMLWDAPTDVEVEDLVGAIVATCSRATVLPGAMAQFPRQKALSRLADDLVNARRTTLVDLVESSRAVDIILYMADRVLAGGVASAVISAHDFEPGHPSDESRRFIEAVEELRALRDDISAGSGRAVRRAANALEMLELRTEFLHDVATAMSEAPALFRISAELHRNLAALAAASNAMLIASIPLCRRFAAQRVEEEEDQEDVFQVAFFGLRRAVSRYNPELGTNFAAYASGWLRQSVLRWRADESRAIRLPVHRQALLAECLMVSDVLEKRLLRAATTYEIAAELGIRGDLAELLTTLPLKPVQLEELDDVAALGTENGIPEALRQADISTLVHEELDQLPGRQADVIRRRFGIGFEDEMTLEEIGQIYGVTRERIRQIEAKGIRILMHPARMRYLSKAL